MLETIIALLMIPVVLIMAGLMFLLCMSFAASLSERKKASDKIQKWLDEENARHGL